MKTSQDVLDRYRPMTEAEVAEANLRERLAAPRAPLPPMPGSGDGWAGRRTLPCPTDQDEEHGDA